MTRMSGCLIIVCGLACAGKTTLAQHLEVERDVGSRSLTRDDINQYVEWFEAPDEAELALFD
jgi:predicted kinase